ncbi:hypothetical protein A2767_03820 [Candidatus Roizmanbacteria bacterium RIFCSPHIGHO2_01_FULL_35_10]|uniref:PABS domain-containing protein n=1 Tax=Candidatus Roizmanbacteria bacterium RIFCSPLOWO2_01_FULL_35_13 TaxID=1802055 RepID=A0A1F7IAA0_9BACT|nr:MAG: hypothetical protein A2767_03820 [Candidatus Roizmanbacteria bacterium RIFCSPHIGHO2_01_FULL_35_10]OGK40252.1 MAG: hypothetical protein A3A74_07135 [Candidatus Roizmanbacteria bacterium RIFCSPLOWO2_01_FULL_35_13]
MKLLFKRYFLLTAIFITGAAVLIVEITATRILSPYFGNTLYTFSSVIGVVLTALSLGYYIGGVYSDKYPTQKLFFSIIILSGFSTLILRVLMSFLLPILGKSFTIISGPLITSTVLFFIPSFLLGMLSPYAVKLRQMSFPKEGVGRAAGEVFFWSTLGSIGGSIGAGFFLIPSFGLNQIINGVALVLFFLGFIGLIDSGEKNKKIILFLIVIFGLFTLIANVQVEKNFLYSKDGVYEKISIYDGFFEGRRTRFFQQDRSSSGAMFLDSDELVYDYTKYYALYKLSKKNPNNVLILGGGAYSIPKAVLKELPHASVDIVEIEPSLYDLAKKYFRLKKTDRLKNYVEDGRRFMFNSNDKYDLIFSDVYYSLYSVPVHFTTKEFFLLAKKKLSSDGIFIANFIGNLKRNKQSLLISEIKTFRSVFPNSYFFALDLPSSKSSQNIIFLGLNSSQKINFEDPKIKNNKDEIISNLKNKLIDIGKETFYSYTLLTDNYAPVEYLTAQVVKQTFEKKMDEFDPDRALDYIKKQLRFGPRYMSSEGHKLTQLFLTSELNKLSDETITQKWNYKSSDGRANTLVNIVGRFNTRENNRILLGAHYDTKRYADEDKINPKDPMPGANDGASGVAVLLEIAQFLSQVDTPPRMGVDIVFFDGEEGEDLSRTDWKPIGSQYFVKELKTMYPENKPLVGIVVDMICDKDLNIFQEGDSLDQASKQVNDFWQLAGKNWPLNFNTKSKYRILDDHTALNSSGIPSFLIIDYDYPYFHTTEDTLDKCSKDSLKVVGNSILNYIYSI